MCDFVTKHWYAKNDMVQTKYEVLSFVMETSNAWMFTCRAITEKVQGKEIDIHGSTLHWCFAKRTNKGQKGGETVWEHHNPPWFLNKMRNRAIARGEYKMQGDGDPEYSDEEINAMKLKF